MFGANDPGGDGPNINKEPPRPEMPPRKVFRVQRKLAEFVDAYETFVIEAHFMAPLDGGRMAFNVYDFDTPQGVSTIRVIKSYYDIEQISPSGIVH